MNSQKHAAQTHTHNKERSQHTGVRHSLAHLIGAEDVPRSSDLEISIRQLEPRPQVTELPHSFQATLRLVGEGVSRGIEEVGVRRYIGTPHPSAHLVQLRQSEHVRVLGQAGELNKEDGGGREGGGGGGGGVSS